MHHKMTKATQKILRVALPTPLPRLFDYVLPEQADFAHLQKGCRVRVPFRSRTLVGFAVDFTDDTEVPLSKLKQVMEVVDQTPLLPENLYALCEWVADYYHCSLGEILTQALPTLLRTSKMPKRKGVIPAVDSTEAPIPLNEAQQQALDAIVASPDDFRVFLLEGVTGSGKTEVYLQAIQTILDAGRQTLILVPEISLTPQMIARFQARFCEQMVAYHSGLSDTERYHAWIAARSGQARVVIGTRSAVFLPFDALGLIVVDEEHDLSFKQQDRFRYHARDVAIMRAYQKHIPIILGSATPALESLWNITQGRYKHLILSERAGGAALPSHHVIDVRKTPVESGLSQPLLQKIEQEVQAGNQILLFLNRRGFAPALYCTECGWIAGCTRCDSRLVYHERPACLKCHYCDKTAAVPKRCVNCQSHALMPVGIGTEQLETVLSKQFPTIPLIRIDRDSTRKKGSMQQLLASIHEEGPAILLGTQMLAKGHHFPRVTLVGIVDADSGLFSADFRAVEHMGQLLIQVAGRAGRAKKKGEVWVQTRQPEHPLLQCLLQAGYPAFSQILLQEREAAALPPFAYAALFRAESRVLQEGNAFLETVREAGGRFASSGISLSGPVPALMAKRKGLYCHQLLVRAPHRKTLQQFLKQMVQHIADLPATPLIKWTLDVDPVTLF
jgi:primosomal protein N' (replication factor Y)